MDKEGLRKGLAELIGTFWLVFAGCGSVMLQARLDGAMGLLAVALAFGLSVVTMAYAIGHISGCHLNPAVTTGLFLAGRFKGKDLPLYVGAQVLGGVVAMLVLLIVADPHSWSEAARAVSNGYGEHSPGRYPLLSGLVAEVVLTFIFLVVILGSTSSKAPPGFAGLAIGLCLAMIHIVGIPVTGVSVNPARSLGPALFGGGWALGQLWLFLLAPVAGAALAGFVSRHVLERP